MKKNLKKALAIILAIMTICTVFAGCKNNKEDEGANPTVNGTTQAEGWSENTTKKDDEASTNTSTSANTTESTTKKEGTTAKKETTTKTYYNNNNSNSAKPTTTKKHETTTKKPVTTTKPNKPNETESTTRDPKLPPLPSKNPKPLTDAQKKEFVDGYFGQFPKYGAKPGFYYEENEDMAAQYMGFTVDQGNYKAMLKSLLDDPQGMRYFANGTTRVFYWWVDEPNGESFLHYRCVNN